MPSKLRSRLIAANVHFACIWCKPQLGYSVQIVHMTLYNDLAFSPFPAPFAYAIIVI